MFVLYSTTFTTSQTVAHGTVYVFLHNLLNELVQITNKMGFKKNIALKSVFLSWEFRWILEWPRKTTAIFQMWRSVWPGQQLKVIRIVLVLQRPSSSSSGKSCIRQFREPGWSCQEDWNECHIFRSLCTSPQVNKAVVKSPSSAAHIHSCS
jgi:hypothetical protein